MQGASFRAIPARIADRLFNKAAGLAGPRAVDATGIGPLVSFTFDDIPDSAYRNGAAILEAHGARGTFYVAGGLCGRETPDGSFASAGACLDLHRRGHEIGCHTYSHRAMRFASSATVEAEASRNRDFFRALDPAIALESFAYPMAAASPAAKLRLQRHYRSCRGGMPGVNRGRIDLGYLKTMELRAGTSLDQMRSWIDRATATRGWLIVLTHDVDESGAPWGCTPDLFDACVARTRAAGCGIATVRDVVRRLEQRPT